MDEYSESEQESLNAQFTEVCDALELEIRKRAAATGDATLFYAVLGQINAELNRN
jgi:hypothetical protein